MRVPAALARATFPAPILHVLRTLAGAGHPSWLVGGAVRDLLLHRRREATDYDVATPARPEEVARLFPKVIPTGIAHGTVTVVVSGEHVEVTTFRGEGAYVDGRRPESVTFLTDLEADLARRDFTMNAMAYDPLGQVFRDPFGGRADMRLRRVRAVGDPAARFGEDGLRALRAVRFAAQLGYHLDGPTRAAIPGALDVVRKVSLERVGEELSKLAVAPHAAVGAALLVETGLLAIALPPLAALPPDAVEHAIAVMGHVPPEPALRFAALLHGLAPEEAERTLLHVRMPRRLADEVTALLRAHACPRSGRAAVRAGSPVELRRWLARAGAERVPALLALAEAEARSVGPAGSASALEDLRVLERAVADVLSAAPPLTIADLALDGRGVIAALGTGPGAHVGEALRHLLDRVLQDPAENVREKLEAELRRWWASRPGRL
jgi:tRNA nucleotidyltransferase (CCA-adding enzyme)